MTLTVRISILVMGIFLFITVLELVRRKKFREELSLIWLLIGIGLILGSYADSIIDPLAFRLGISYPPTLVFVLIFFLFLFVILYFSIIVSDLKSKSKELGQKMALMEYRLRELYQRKD